MSWLIDYEQFPYQIQRIKNQQVKLYVEQSDKLKFSFEEAFSHFCNGILIKKVRNDRIEFKMSVQKYVDNLDVVFLMNLNFKLKIMTVDCNIFKNKLPFLINSKERSKILIKQTLKQNLNSQNTTISIFLGNGQLSFRIILPTIEGYKCFFKNLRQIIFGKPLKRKISNFIQKIQKGNYEKQKQNNNSQKLKRLNQIYKYFYRTAMQPTISIKSDSNRQETINERLYQEVKCLQNLSKNNLEVQLINKQYFKTINIFSICQELYQPKLINQMTIYQRQTIYQMLYISQSKNINSKQNKYTFNQIIFQENNCNKVKICEGGKSQIYIIKARIIQINSFDKTQKTQLKSNEKFKEKYFTKHLVLKQKINKQSNSMKSLSKKDNFLFTQVKDLQNNLKKTISEIKLKRQIQIVSRMKLGSCAFLPKFYHNIQKNSPYEKYLLSQYIPSTNLRQFIQLHSYSMSLTTKLYIVFQIIQSLRFISRYKIVHLDVKQSNFIIYNRLLIKLLDFQQAFHPEICGNNHKLDFSIPYASPEVVLSAQGRSFSEKSDVYSLGVLMHNIFYNKLPFYLSQNSFYEIHSYNQMQKRLFWNSQEHLTYGLCCQILKIISQIILKCISSKQIERPYLDWIAVTIKSCLNYFIEA